MMLPSLILWVLASCQDSEPFRGYFIVEASEASRAVDRRAIVHGKVVSTWVNWGRTHLCLGEDREKDFTIVVGERFENFDGESWKGQRVAVAGVVSDELAQPEVFLSALDQLVRIPPGRDGKDLAQSHFRGAIEIPDPPSQAPRDSIRVATYNVLNLFDGHEDPYHADEVMKEKPRHELEKVASRIRELNADVLCLQEVENRDALEFFVAAYLPEAGYEIVLIEGNNYRGIDCAVLSRFPLGPVTSYRHVSFQGPDGKTYRFRRDLLQVEVRPPGFPPIDVYCIHLHSKYGGAERSEPVRQAEAIEIRKWLDRRLAQDPQALFVLAGDFNDTWESPSLKILKGTGAGTLSYPGESLPQEKRVTYNQEPYRSTIDFILLSPALAPSYTPASYTVISGTVEDSGSDHNPVVLELRSSRKS